MRRVAVGIVLTLAGGGLAVAAQAALARPGDRVQSFGDRGLVFSKLPGRQLFVAGGGSRPGGGVVLGGHSGASIENGGQITVLAYSPTGGLDRSFGRNGWAVAPTAGVASATKVAVDGRGRVLVMGTSRAGDVVLARFTRRGRVDAAFGIAGVLRLGFGAPFGYVTALAVESSGAIAVGGSVPGKPEASVVLRLRADGTVASSFGAGGTAEVRSAFPGAPGSPFSVNAIVVRRDGRMVAVAGGTDAVHLGARNVEVLELDRNGRRASGFGSLVATAGDARVAALTAGGKLLIAGSKETATGSVFALSRFTGDGRLDSSFGGGDGTVTTNFGTKRGRESVNAIVTTGSRRIVLAGEATDSALRHSRFALARYTSAGVLDPSFASRGKLLTRFGAQAAAARVAVRSRAGTVIVAGSGLRSDFSRPRDRVAYLARYRLR